MKDNTDTPGSTDDTRPDATVSGDRTEPETLPRRGDRWQRLGTAFKHASRQLAWIAAALVMFSLGWWLSPGGADPHEHPAAPGSAAGQTIWTCSMHPQIRLPEPGACPICGMDLIPLESNDNDETKTKVKLSPAAAKRAELRTVKVYRGEASDTLRLLGRLEYDETAVRTVTAWIGGRIDRLYVSALGVKVNNGQPIAEVYSPEVYAAQQDLIVARRQIEALRDALPISQKAARASYESARRRLRLLGIPEKEVDAMAEESAPRERVVILSTASGTVLEQMVNQGAYVSTGSPLFRVAALNRIWIQLDAYETDLARIEEGNSVEVQVTSYPGEVFEGKVTFIDPIVDPDARTARVRIEVANKDGRLRPGMFAVAVIRAETPAAKRSIHPLIVPDSAVLFTGERSVVFVETQVNGQLEYEAREVQLGPRVGNAFPVVSGLEEGERVVAQGAFTLDAELQIRGGKSMMTLPDDVARGKRRPFQVDPKLVQRLSPLVLAYLDLSSTLAKDDLPNAKLAYKALEQALAKIHIGTPTDAAKRWQELEQMLTQAIRTGRDAPDLAAARKPFEPLSQAMTEILRRFGNPIKDTVRLAHCPMAAGGGGAEWLQLADDVRNPYFGSKMYTCGEIQSVAKPLEHLPEADSEEASSPTAVPPGHQH